MPENHKPKTVIISAKGKNSFSPEQVQMLQSKCNVTFIASLEKINDQYLIDIARDAKILALTPRSRNEIGKSVLAQLPKLTSLAVFSTGKEWIDTDYLEETEKNVLFLEAYSARTVAEHALGMMLFFSRKFNISTKENLNSISKQGFELKGKTLGILGMGRIGTILSHMCHALGMNIVYHDIEDKITDFPRQSFELVLSSSHVIAVTANGNRGGEPLIHSNSFQYMEKIPIIVNVARSHLVDIQSIFENLQSKRIGGYAVDDSIKETIPSQIQHSILQTGHTAWYSKEAIARGTDEWVNNIITLASPDNNP